MTCPICTLTVGKEYEVFGTIICAKCASPVSTPITAVYIGHAVNNLIHNFEPVTVMACPECGQELSVINSPCSDSSMATQIREFFSVPVTNQASLIV